MAALIHAQPGEIVFTAGGTEAAAGSAGAQGSQPGRLRLVTPSEGASAGTGTAASWAAAKSAAESDYDAATPTASSADAGAGSNQAGVGTRGYDAGIVHRF